MGYLLGYENAISLTFWPQLLEKVAIITWLVLISCPGLNEPTIYVAFLLASSLSSSFLFSLFGQKLKLCWAACLFFFLDSLTLYWAMLQQQAVNYTTLCSVSLISREKSANWYDASVNEVLDMKIKIAFSSWNRIVTILTSFFLVETARASKLMSAETEV